MPWKEGEIRKLSAEDFLRGKAEGGRRSDSFSWVDIELCIFGAWGLVWGLLEFVLSSNLKRCMIGGGGWRSAIRVVVVGHWSMLEDWVNWKVSEEC
jgi:hypothetical protein